MTTSHAPEITAAWVARAAVGLERDISDEKLAQLLPFRVKFVLKQNPLTDVCSMDLIPDKWRAASSLLCPKVCTQGYIHALSVLLASKGLHCHPVGKAFREEPWPVDPNHG